MNFLGYSIHNSNTPCPIYEFSLITSRDITTWEIDESSNRIVELRDDPSGTILYVKNVNNSFDSIKIEDQDWRFIAHPTPFRYNGALIPVTFYKFKKLRYQELVPVLVSKLASKTPACRRCRLANRKPENCARNLAVQLKNLIQYK